MTYKIPHFCKNFRTLVLVKLKQNGWLDGRLVGWLVGWSVGRLVGWLVGWLVFYRPVRLYQVFAQGFT